MLMRQFKKIALQEMGKKTIKLHKTGLSIEQIKEKFYTQPHVAKGLALLGIDDVELTKMIEKEISKKEGK